jgi:hypothetical protein
MALNAQEQEKPLPNYAVSVEPLFLYNGGLRLNVEKRLTPKQWIELNVTGYRLPEHKMDDDNYYNNSWWNNDGWITSNADFNSFSKLSGAGLGGTYKYYFYSSNYVSGGISYAYSGVQYKDYTFHPYTEEGLTYYSYGLHNVNQDFHRLAGNLCIGTRSAFYHAYLIEFYGGLGYTHSFYDKDKRTYDETMFGFGYKGMTITFGFKFGFNFK